MTDPLTAPALRLFANDERGALISDDGQYRYQLWRRWDADAPTMVWVMLNPSTADASLDDPTIRKCMGFARKHNHGGIVVVNLFAWRATNPKELPRVADPIGPENDRWIFRACTEAPGVTVVAGWGANKFAGDRAGQVRGLVQNYLGSMHCFGRSQNGSPNHPCYLPYDTPMERF